MKTMTTITKVRYDGAWTFVTATVTDDMGSSSEHSERVDKHYHWPKDRHAHILTQEIKVAAIARAAREARAQARAALEAIQEES